MPIPTVEKCCCGCNLRLGSAIIGVLFFLSGLSQTISFSVRANNINDQNTEEGESKATYIVNAVVAAVMMLSTIILLWGVHKERPGLLKPWLILFSVLTTICVVVFIIGAIVAFAIALPAAGAILLVAGLVYLLIYGYCLVVVHSYHLELIGTHPAGLQSGMQPEMYGGKV